MVDYENKLKSIIENDIYMMSVLKAVEKLNLEDAWVCAGFIRNKVWPISPNIPTPPNHLHVLHLAPPDPPPANDNPLAPHLHFLLPHHPSPVNIPPPMHLKSDFKPFTSSYDGVAHFPETPTAIAVRIYNRDIEIMAPYGLQDLFEMRVTPTPFFQEDNELHSIFVERIKKKRWNEIWENLYIEF